MTAVMPQAATRPPRYEVAVDIGGTFTDVVCRGGGEMKLVKIPTTRSNPSAGVMHAIRHMSTAWKIAPEHIERFVHGTTVATNAVLERKGAKIGLITTRGFKDVLEIGRQNRRNVYSVMLEPQTPAFLAPGALRREVPERIAATGEILVPLDEDALRREARALAGEGVQAIAICFLFSFLNPVHERRAAEIVREHHPGLMVSISSEVDPAFREYERTCITAFDAYLKPVIDRYLASMESDLETAGLRSPLQIMQSRGGIASSRVARRSPVRLFLSGPAAGVIGGRAAGEAAGFDDLITIDIGGTSADIALIERGKPLIASEGRLDGYAVRVPMVDVNAIGAGGGSIAWLDAGRSLRVGPHSAGSDPGPACYGRGGAVPTVTDASIVLGYIDPDYFAGGTMKLEPALAWKAIEREVAKALGMSVEQAALGIHRVINARMAEGIRFVSVRRGIDPRRFTLVALGGGGPVHATALAHELGIERVVVPLHPGVLSAAGLLAAPIEHEAATAFNVPLTQATHAMLARALTELDAKCDALMAGEQVPRGAIERRYLADVCYVGQSYHLEVPLHMEGDTLERLGREFYEAHDRVYGHSTRGPIRFVNVRAVHQAHAAGVGERLRYVCADGSAMKGTRRILASDSAGFVNASVYERTRMQPGTRLHGPAIVEQADTTTLVEPGWQADIDASGNLILTRPQA
jgi:N-methylhydantoinase A/oxoprolinase/acetone carboxylase beta subunit